MEDPPRKRQRHNERAAAVRRVPEGGDIFADLDYTKFRRVEGGDGGGGGGGGGGGALFKAVEANGLTTIVKVPIGKYREVITAHRTDGMAHKRRAQKTCTHEDLQKAIKELNKKMLMAKAAEDFMKEHAAQAVETPEVAGAIQEAAKAVADTVYEEQDEMLTAVVAASVQKAALSTKLKRKAKEMASEE